MLQLTSHQNVEIKLERSVFAYSLKEELNCTNRIKLLDEILANWAIYPAGTGRICWQTVSRLNWFFKE